MQGENYFVPEEDREIGDRCVVLLDRQRDGVTVVLTEGTYHNNNISKHR